MAPVSESLSPGLMVAYAMPSLTFGGVTIMIGTQLALFYADQVGVPLSTIGVLTTAVNFWDAITDPGLGWASDRISSARFGRRKPMFILGSALLAPSFVVLFTPPLHLSQAAATAYVAVALFAVVLFWTTARQPWMAWGVEVTPVHDLRTQLFAVREGLFVVGTLMSAVLPASTISLLPDISTRLFVLSMFWAGCILASTAACAIRVPDHALSGASTATASQQNPATSVSTTSAGSTRDFLGYFMSNTPGKVVWVIRVCFGTATIVNAIVFPFFARHVVDMKEGAEYVMAGYIVMGIVFLPIWTKLAKSFRKVRVLAVAIGIQSICLLSIYAFVGRHDIPLYTTLAMTAGCCYGSIPAVYFSMISDVSDLQQLLSRGKRDEGKLIGLYDLSQKCAASLAILAAFATIDAMGYESAATERQVESARRMIAVWYSLVPGFLAAVSVMATMFYSLDQEAHAEVMAKLAELREQPEPAKSGVKFHMGEFS